MADSVVKLRIDSKEYDANIKRAGQALQNYFNTVRQGGGTLEYLDEGVLEAVQSMGQMATAAASSKGQLREMTVALNDMLGQYRSLTDAERNTPLGAAMSQSISELTQRAGVLRDAMDDVNATIRLEASDTKGFDQVSAAVQGMTTAFQVGQGAAQLLGIEMDDAMKVMAKLQAAMAITSGLQQAQNLLQKESALMYGVQSVQMGIATTAQSAVAAATGSATAAQAAFNAVASANPYALLLTAAGALVGVIAAFASTTGESTEEVKDAKKEMDSLSQSVNDAAEAYDRLKDKVKSLGIGGQKEYHILRQSKQDQYDALNERYSNVGYNMRFYEKRGETDSPIYKELQEEHKKIEEEAAKIKKEIDKLDAANKDRISRINQYKRLDFSDITTESEAQSALSFLKDQKKYKDPTSKDYGNIKRAIEYVENILLPQFQDKTEAKAKSQATHVQQEVTILAKSIGDYEKQIKDLRATEKNVTTTEEWETLQHKIGELVIKVKELKGELKDVPANISDATNAATDAQNKKIQDRMNDPETVSKGVAAIVNDIENKNKKEDKGTDTLAKFKDLSAGLNQVAGGLQQMGIQLPKGVSDVLGVMNGAISVIQGISTIISVGQTSALSANTIALGALTSAIITNTAMNFIPFYSTGGIVPTFAQGGLIGRAAAGMTIPGNSMSGDLLRMPVDGGRGLIGVNSGELILNKSSQNSLAFDLLSAESLVGTIRDAQMSLGSMQQGMVADALNSRDDAGGYGGMPFVSGENIVLGVNNHFKRSGQGEIVTTSMLRRKGIIL